MVRIRSLVILISLLISSYFYGQQVSITITGSSTVKPILEEAAAVFEKRTGIKVYVTGGGSDFGITSVTGGSVSIGAVSRPLTEEEINSGLFKVTIGYDSVVVIVYADSSIDNLTSVQVNRFYSGTIYSWKQFEGPEKDVVVVDRESGRAEKKLFNSIFTIGSQDHISSFVYAGSNMETIMLIAGDPYAIGYVSWGSAYNAVDMDFNIKILSIDSVEPTGENILNGSYPIKRELNLVTAQKPTGAVKLFIDFLLSEEGQKIVEKMNFIPLKKS